MSWLITWYREDGTTHGVDKDECFFFSQTGRGFFRRGVCLKISTSYQRFGCCEGFCPITYTVERALEGKL